MSTSIFANVEMAPRDPILGLNEAFNAEKNPAKVNLGVGVAMLIAPGAIAYLLSDRFERMLAIAAAVAIGSSVVGTLVSFHIDGATGPCIVLIQMAVFLLAFLFGPDRGALPIARVIVGPARDQKRNAEIARDVVGRGVDVVRSETPLVV